MILSHGVQTQTERAAEFKAKFIEYLESLMKMQEQVHVTVYGLEVFARVVAKS